MSLNGGNPMTAELVGRWFKFRVVCSMLDGSVRIYSCRTVGQARKIAAAHFCACLF